MSNARLQRQSVAIVATPRTSSRVAKTEAIFRRYRALFFCRKPAGSSCRRGPSLLAQVEDLSRQADDERDEKAALRSDKQR